MSSRIPLLFALLLTACDPASEEQAADLPTDTLADAPAAIEAPVRVRVEAAAVRPLAGVGELIGVVEPFASVVVAAETAARVEARHIERGERVEADALLYTLDGSRMRIEYRRAQASVEARERDRAMAELELERSAKLHARESISAAAHDRTSHAAESAAAAEELAAVSRRAASRSLRDTNIRAPFDGVVAEFHVERGDFVGPGAAVASIVDLSRVRLRVGLTAAELDSFELGARVPVRFADLGGRSVEAELRSVSPLADPRTGTYAAELWLDNHDGQLRQGMLGRVELGRAGAHHSVLGIPRAAVVRRGREFCVWVVEHDGDSARVEPRPVILGRADASRVEVFDGLAPGDELVIEGMFALREGAAVIIEDQ